MGLFLIIYRTNVNVNEKVKSIYVIISQISILISSLASFFSSFRNHSILFFLTLFLENKLIQKESGTLVLRCVYRVSNALGIDT